MMHDGFKNITLQQMEALMHLIGERSFSRAAKKMLLTQPALTKHIQNLESAAGARIVNRGGAGVSLTPEGKVLYDYAGRMLRLREEAKDKIARARGSASGIIFVAASTIPATYILPRILASFRRGHPGIEVRVRAADSEEALETILGGEAEIGLVGKRPPERRIHAVELWADRLALTVPAGHPWAGRKSVAVRELAGEPFVVREKGSATREIMEACLKKNGGLNLSDLNVVAEMGSSEAVKEAVIAGVGLSVLSVHAVARERKQGVVACLAVRTCSFERSFYLIYRRQFDLMHHHWLFLDYLKTFKLREDEPREEKV
jgi:DNA-binding transcriptional LysR family regulator